MLFGQFRKGDANDPKTYTASIAAVLAEYPEDVIRQATDPRTGLGSHLDWLPTVKEVRDFCCEIVEAEARAAQRERDLQTQIAGRAEYEAARAKAPSRADIRAKLSLPTKPVQPLEPAKLYAKVKAAQELYKTGLTISAETRAILERAGYSI